MQNIGITGGNGFLAWHLRCRLKMLGFENVSLADRACFNNQDLLNDFVLKNDIVVHLAGVNRADTDDMVKSGNINIAKQLAMALTKKPTSTHVIFSNSTKIEEDGVYGEAKKQSAQIIQDALTHADGTMADIVFPHLYGEYGRPKYNSAVHTFAYQIVSNEQSKVVVDSVLELLHAQEAAQIIIDSFERTGQFRPSGEKIKVSHALQKMQELIAPYLDNGTIPEIKTAFELHLFNTIKSYFKPSYYPIPLTLHSDHRGSFFEVVRSQGQGQTSISTTKPGIVRGDHFHQNKIERFSVISGNATIKIRKLFSDKINTYHVCGDQPVIIDIPTLSSHNITNTGDDLLTTLFWCHDLFDPAYPDTYSEPVEIN